MPKLISYWILVSQYVTISCHFGKSANIGNMGTKVTQHEKD